MGAFALCLPVFTPRYRFDISLRSIRLSLGSRPEVSEQSSGVSQQRMQQQQSPFCNRAGISAVPARLERIAGSNQCAQIIQAGIRTSCISEHVFVGTSQAAQAYCNRSLCAAVVCAFLQQCMCAPVCVRAVAPQAQVCTAQLLARPSRRRRAAKVQCAGVHFRPAANADFMQQSQVCAAVQSSQVCPRIDRKHRACVARHGTSNLEGMNRKHPRDGEHELGDGRV
jgi:hypothetical protein